MKLLRKIQALFRKDKLEADMAEEMQLHLEQRTRENIAAGMAPEDARYAARRKFGGVEQVKERARDERGWAWLDGLAQDFRYAIRQLRKTPAFTVVAVLTLGLGIGANTAVFSLVEEVLLKSLPVKNPDELVLFGQSGRLRANSPHWIQGNGGLSPVIFSGLRERGTALAEIFGFGSLSVNAVIDGQPQMPPEVHLVSGNYFTALGITASAGRLLAPADESAAMPVAVISDRFWNNRFKRDVTAVGKTVWLNSVAVTIVGVAAQGFSGAAEVGHSADFFIPLLLAPRLMPDPGRRYEMDQPSYWWLRTMGRLRPGVTAEQARNQLDDAFRQMIFADFPETEGQPDQPHLQVQRGSHGLGPLESFRQSLLILSGLAGLVLLVACVNLANLLLARGAARRKELATRLALGATRRRVVRQLFSESVLLVALGGSLGVLFAKWGKDLLLAQLFGDSVLTPSLDGGVLAFTLAVASATGLMFGLVPAFRATRVDLTAEFNGGAARSGRKNRLGAALLITQVAISLILLVGAGLFIRTFQNLQQVDAGFNVSRLLLFRIDTAVSGRSRAAATALYDEIRDRIAAVPGVQNVSFSYQALLSGGMMSGGGGIFGYKHQAGQMTIGGDYNGVGKEFFRTMQIPVLAGRDFDERDMTPTAEVVVINQSLAREVFESDNPIGRRTSFGEVIGVVADVHYDQLRRKPAPTAYVPFGRLMRTPGGQGNFAVRTLGDPRAVLASVREIVHGIDPQLPLYDVRTQDEQVTRLLSRESLFARLAGFFGVLALGLVCIGLYGLTSFGVLQRTREIGVRMAVGAAPSQVLVMVLRESLIVVTLGLALGIGGAIAAVRLITNQLYGISPFDLPTYGSMTLVLVAVALVAAFFPARRAAKVDPVVALRAE